MQTGISGIKKNLVKLSDGQRMFYRSAGDNGKYNLVFIHGMPLSSYMWRNVIPPISMDCHCIALDMMGMGESDKPGIQYNHQEHREYVADFMNKIPNDKIIMIGHGWGSIYANDWAANNPDRVHGLVCYEGYIRPPHRWEELSLPMQQFAFRMGTDAQMRKKIIDENYFFTNFLPNRSLNQFDDKTRKYYSSHYVLPAHRQVFLQYARELPLGGDNASSQGLQKIMDSYQDYLTTSLIPKLMLYSTPGFVVDAAAINWARENCKNITISNTGLGYHYAPETDPVGFTNSLLEWLIKNKLIG
jgi:haloalkane dehalogenase